MIDLEFEWDLVKDAVNLTKHGCSFLEAVETFKDPKGLQLVDRKHSNRELRRYWIGRSSAGRVLTTWFTMRGPKIRIIGCAEWRKFRSLYETAQNEGPSDRHQRHQGYESEDGESQKDQNHD